MFDFQGLKKYIVENHEEVSAILESERLTILNSPGIKILHSKFLIDFWEERPNKNLTYTLYFQESFISNFNFDFIKTNLNGVITETLKTHKIIEINNDFSVKEKSAREINKKLLIKLSDKKNVVFFFGEEGIDVAIRGKIIDNINFFYNEADRLLFLKKYHISNLQDCLNDYKVFIKEPGNNEAFFASRKLILRIKPTTPPNNTLHNKPEKILRDNLISYLNRNTQHTFSKEN